MRRLALFIALASLAACSGEGEPAAPAPSPRTPPSAMLIGRNLTMTDDAPIRIGFEPFRPSARVIVTFEPQDAQVDVCPIPSFDAALPERARCTGDVRTGVRETVSGSGMMGIAVMLHEPAAASVDLVVEYQEGRRDLRIGLPVVRAPSGDRDCSDNACNPFFELQPTRAGSFDATATWTGPDGVFVLLQGSVLGGAQTATGIPYGEPARAEGSSPLRIETRLSAPAEYALALRHARQGATAGAMTDVVLRVAWP